MKEILPTDIIYATVTQRGRVLASIKLKGMKTIGEIYNYIKRLLEGSIGLVTFSLRNSSQGWRDERNIMLSRVTLR
ncbi:MAG: hypothetical protein J1E38_06060 [Paramuribaculum sp.]|nr:hypothetical protein [Paramuribaculum sp.]